MASQNNLKNKNKEILLGNDALVRGALQAGVQFVTTYPGTPASDIGDRFFLIAKEQKIYFEYSINEKTALEAGIGSSYSGLKTLVAMKNFGLNVASDALLPFVYTGSKAPFVLVVADDPSCHSSAQSEENSRAFAYLAHIPVLEPADSQECYDFIQEAFQISENFKIPVMIRLTTRVAHQRAIVAISKIKNQKSKITFGKFIPDRQRFVTMPPRVLEMKQELLEKINKIKNITETSKLNFVSGKQEGKIGIIASGVAYLHTKEALMLLGLDLPVFKLGFFYPLPEKKIKKFVKSFQKIFIVEELEGFLEKEIKAIASPANLKAKIFGKSALSEVGELDSSLVAMALSKILNKKYALSSVFKKVKHLPRFCVGWPTCPYWKLFAAVRQAAPKNTIFGGDIGCYMIAALPPHNLYDYLLCMGSSIGVAHGIKKATNQKIIAFIGDGTFFHSGIAGLMNASYNKADILVIVLDNRITAMTGHQANPGMGKSGTGEEANEIKIEEVAKALKIRNIKVIDQEEQYQELVKTIKSFLGLKGVSLIVARRICGLLAKRNVKK